ncbi:hypothetical protein [Nonomuraea sp. LPB2021202275-12-8]|uniref:hypothetical protein n=1 Tax=Nonomuraea sp. LPB2021202275-12-8 TaxID=3120159 RepID=UPI00300C3454
MLSRLLDRLWGPKTRRRDLHDGPTYGWIQTDDGITQVLLSLYRVTIGRPRGPRRPVVAWEVEWAMDLANEAFAPVTGAALPVTEDAVRFGTWDILACTLLRHEIALNPARYGLPEAA